MRKKMFIFLFLLPSIILFMVFFAVPIFELIVTSFCRWKLGTKITFVGFKNYQTMFFANSDFMSAMLHTLIWTVLTPAVQVPLALVVALVLSKKPFGWRFVRNAYVIPCIISTAAIGMLFQNMFDADYGVVNALIRLFDKNFSMTWLGNNHTAFTVVTLSWILYGGTMVLLFMAEISSISESVLEAAKVDGATNFQIDCLIIIPMLRNIAGTITLMTASYGITEFGEVFMITNGGPGSSTLNLGVYLYKTAMLENNYGRANTVGVIQMIIGLLAVVLITKVFRLGKSY